MRSEQSLGRKTLAGALALASLLAGCETASPVLGRDIIEDSETRSLLARIRCPRTTLTPKELGEIYPEKAWSFSGRDFKPVYQKITEADAFDWEYLRELQGKRGALLARAERKRAAEQKKARAAEQRERARKAKVDAKAAALAARAEVIEKAKRAPAATTPEAAPTPSE